MTDEELSLKIAEHLEPKPNGTGPISRKEMIHHNKTGVPILSQAKAWWWHGKTLEWQPRNFVTNPAMTVLLIGELIKAGQVIIWSDGSHVSVTAQTSKFDYSSHSGENIGRPTAEAFARAKGLI